MVQENKTQKPGRSNAPGFRTPSDEDSSANAGSIKVDKITKDHGKKVAARGKVNAGKAASKESTTNASSTKKASNSAKKTSANTNQKIAQTSSANSKVSHNLSVAKAVSKKSARSKKGETVTTQRNDSDDDSLDLNNVEGMREEMAQIQKDEKRKKPLAISVSPPARELDELPVSDRSVIGCRPTLLLWVN